MYFFKNFVRVTSAEDREDLGDARKPQRETAQEERKDVHTEDLKNEPEGETRKREFEEQKRAPCFCSRSDHLQMLGEGELLTENETSVSFTRSRG